MNPINLRALEKLKGDFALSPEQFHRFYLYVQLIENWNKRTNLVSMRDISRIVTKHIYESLSYCAMNVIPQIGILVDIGSGAGFPGVPIKIIQPSLEVHLIDAKRMRYLFLVEVIDMLQLKNTYATCDRVETIANHKILNGNIIVARSVAKLKTLWEWSVPILAPQGKLIVQKDGEVQQELEDLQSRWQLNIRIIKIQEHKFVIISKI